MTTYVSERSWICGTGPMNLHVVVVGCGCDFRGFWKYEDEGWGRLPTERHLCFETRFLIPKQKNIETHTHSKRANKQLQ